jgi:hypothetical protein
MRKNTKRIGTTLVGSDCKWMKSEFTLSHKERLVRLEGRIGIKERIYVGLFILAVFGGIIIPPMIVR